MTAPVTTEPLAPPDYRARVQELFRAAAGAADHALTLGHPTALRYFTGAGEGIGLLGPAGDITILTAALQTEAARATGFSIREYGHRHEYDHLAACLRPHLPAGARVGYWGEHLSVRQAAFLEAALPDRTLVDLTDAFVHLATYKDDAEIARLRAACRIASEVVQQVPDLLREGMTELELAADINHRLIHAGGEGTTFGTIVAFGPNSAFPHARTGERCLRRGDFVLVDFGAMVGGCGSDITRTFVFGPVTDKQRTLYDLVARAQEAALALCEQRAPKDAINVRCSAVFAEGGYGPMVHGVGHGLGLLGRCPFCLDPACVSTVEPGLYVPGVGGVRIEDDILTTEDGVELLTGAPRALIVV